MWLFQRSDKKLNASNNNAAGNNSTISGGAQTENVSEIQINNTLSSQVTSTKESNDSNNIINTTNHTDKNVRSEVEHDPIYSTFTSSSSHSCFCLLPSHEEQMDNKDNDNNNDNNSKAVSLSTMPMTHKPLLRPIKDIDNATENHKNEMNNNYNNNNEAKEKNACSSNSISNTITRITSTSSLPCSLPLHNSSMESQSYSPIAFPDNTPAHSHRMESSDYSIQPSLQFPPSATCFSEWTVMTSTEDASQPVSLSTGGPIQAHFIARNGSEHTHDHTISTNNEESSSNSKNSTNDTSMSSMMHQNNNNNTITNQYMVRAFSSNKESVEGSEIPTMTPSNDKSSCNAVCGSISDVNQNNNNVNNNNNNNHCYYLPKLDLMSLFQTAGNRGNKISTLHKAERAVNKSSAMMEEWISNTTASANANNNNNVMSIASSSLNDTGSYHILVHDSMYTSTNNNNNENNSSSGSRTNISSPQTFIVSTGNSTVNANIVHTNNNNNNNNNSNPIPATSLPSLSPHLPEDHPLTQSVPVLSYNSWNTISERTPTKVNNVSNGNGFLRRIVRTSSLSSSLSASSFSCGLLSPSPAFHENQSNHPQGNAQCTLGEKFCLNNMNEIKAAIASHILTHCNGVNGCLQSASSYCYSWWCYAHLARFKLHHLNVEGVTNARGQIDQAIIDSLVKSSSLVSHCAARVWDVVREDITNHWYPQIMLVLGDEWVSYKGEHRPHSKYHSSCEDINNNDCDDDNNVNKTERNGENVNNNKNNNNNKEKNRSKVNSGDLYELSWLWSLTSGSIIGTLQNILISLP